MKLIVFFTITFMISLSHAQGNKILDAEPKIIYKYKKYQKFDFEDLVIEGETGSPGDLSIAPRYQRKFKNKLPYRKNFNAEMRRSVERIR
jgi:hypothetical protein